MRVSVVRLWLLLLLLACGPGRAEEHADLAALAACVNARNGLPEDLRDADWALPQAEVPRFYEDDKRELAEGWDFLAGRRLGWHGTWLAVLRRDGEAWTVFDALSEDARLAAFGQSFVPEEVRAALPSCGARWGGHWSGAPTFLKAPPERMPAAPEPAPKPRVMIDGRDLLPPASSE